MQKCSMPLHLFWSSFISPIKFCSCLYIGHTHFSLRSFLSIFPLLFENGVFFAMFLPFQFWQIEIAIQEFIDYHDKVLCMTTLLDDRCYFTFELLCILGPKLLTINMVSQIVIQGSLKKVQG